MLFSWASRTDSNVSDIPAGLFSLLCTVVFLLFWKPKRIWRFAEDTEVPGAVGAPAAVTSSARPVSAAGSAQPALTSSSSYTTSQIFKAWIPFLILSVFVFLWGYKPIKDYMNVHTTPAWLTAEGKANGGWNTPLHRKISRDKPVVPKPTPEAAKFPFILLSATGTGSFLPPIA